MAELEANSPSLPVPVSLTPWIQTGRPLMWGSFRKRLLARLWPPQGFDFTDSRGLGGGIPDMEGFHTALRLTPPITQVTGRRCPRMAAQRPNRYHFVRAKVNYKRVFDRGSLSN
ncbi:hypothetical protein SRHO_G00314350 [Serrasalmus rhombeus]